MDRWKAEELANKLNVPTYCIWCREDCERTQILNNGQEWERWCYCKNCNEESFHLITDNNE